MLLKIEGERDITEGAGEKTMIEVLPAHRLQRATVLGLTLLAGCAAFPVGPWSSPRGPDEEFTHRSHLPQVGGQCVTCHEPYGGGGFYLVAAGLCQRCHSETGDDPRYQPDVERIGQRRIVGAFHHDRHREASTAAGKPAGSCAGCHSGIEVATRRSQRNVPTMEHCYTCHRRIVLADGRAGTECRLCHLPDDFHEEKLAALRQALDSGQSAADMDPQLIPPSHR